MAHRNKQKSGAKGTWQPNMTEAMCSDKHSRQDRRTWQPNMTEAVCSDKHDQRTIPKPYAHTRTK